MKIAAMNDRILDLSIARAVYTLSCAPENLSKMAGHNILTLVKLLWDAQAAVEEDSPESVQPQELHKLLIATMYNLSTNLESQNLLVTRGYIELVMSMWEVAKKDRDTCSLACYSVYHMACGTTSSSRLVNCGCAHVLCFVWAAHAQNIPEFKEYSFPLDMQLRCAMAMRNMMCVVANQQELVAAGCVDALVSIAQWAESKSAAHPSKGGGLKRYSISPVPTSIKNMKGENDIRTLEETRKHCAAALRCLTFNKGLRDGLSSRGAVTVLLDDLTASMKEEVFPIDYDLLCQLEAESWQNGSRSKGAKEGRAPAIGTAPIHTTLLSITQKIAIEFTVRSAVLQKYRVKVHLEEPLMEQGTAFDPLLEDVSTLTAFVNPDSNRSTVTSQSEKKEWPALDLTLALASPEGVEIAAPQRARSSTSEGTSMDSCREDRKQSLEALSMPHTHTLDDWRDRLKVPSSSSGERKPSIPRGHSQTQTGSSSSRRSLHYSLPEVKYSRSLTLDNDYRNLNRLNSSHSQLDMSLPSDLPPLPSSLSSGRLAKKGKVRVVPRSEEKFNNLVSFINHTRKTKGDIGDVLNKWSKFSSK